MAVPFRSLAIIYLQVSAILADVLIRSYSIEVCMREESKEAIHERKGFLREAERKVMLHPGPPQE